MVAQRFARATDAQIAHAEHLAHAGFRRRRDVEVRRLLAGTPAALRALPRWTLWSWERNEDDRWTKVPSQAFPRDTRYPKASSTDPRTWCGFAGALGQFEAGDADGLLFALTDDDPCAVIDLDHCRDPASGALTPFALDIVEKLDSFTEISPSGRGLHIWIEAELPHGAVVDHTQGRDIEIYDAGRFMSCTARPLARAPRRIHSRQAALDALLAELWPEEALRRAEGGGPESVHTPGPRLRVSPPMPDAEVLARAATARNSRKFVALWRGHSTDHRSASEDDLALINHLIFFTQDEAQLDRLFRHSGRARAKWADRQDYRQRTFDRAFRGRTARDFFAPGRRADGGGGTGRATRDGMRRATQDRGRGMD